MTIGEGHTLGCESIVVRGLNLGFLVAVGDIRHTHVVRVEDDDVGALLNSFKLSGETFDRQRERGIQIFGPTRRTEFDVLREAAAALIAPFRD